MTRSIRTMLTLSPVLLTTGCSQAPAIDVMGSLFPAWLLCIALGIALTAISHWQFTRHGFSFLFPFLTYPCLTALYTFAIWLVFF